jgi:hypothetical protein
MMIVDLKGRILKNLEKQLGVEKSAKVQMKKLAKSIDDLPNLFEEFKQLEQGAVSASDLTFSDAASAAQEVQEAVTSCDPSVHGEELCGALAGLAQGMSGYQQFGNESDFDAEGFLESVMDSVKEVEQAYNDYKASKTASRFFNLKKRSDRR